MSARRIHGLDEARKKLQGMEGGTVPVSLALEIIDAAEAELAASQGEYTIAQAVTMSGRSRAWFERRLPEWEEQGLARKPGRDWLLKAAVIPERERSSRGFDPRESDDDILRRLREEDRRQGTAA